MEKNSSQILTDYDSKKSVYTEFGDAVLSLMKYLINGNVTPHQVSRRIKDRDSLSTKLTRKDYKYSTIKEITDIVGLRIVTYFEDDIDKIAEIFKREFDIDFSKSIDKRKVDADRFGYRSLHYVASMNKERLTLTEYKRFKDLKFEVQIRSILQHSWAEIEHDLGYKSESEMPTTAKRTFYRVAALLEQADIEFVKLRTEILAHETLIKEQIVIDSSSVKVDKSSLIVFIQENTILNEIEDSLENNICPRTSNIDSSYISHIVTKLNEHFISNLNEVETLLIKYRTEIIDHVINDYNTLSQPLPDMFLKGASISWLLKIIDER